MWAMRTNEDIVYEQFRFNIIAQKGNKHSVDLLMMMMIIIMIIITYAFLSGSKVV